MHCQRESRTHKEKKCAQRSHFYVFISNTAFTLCRTVHSMQHPIMPRQDLYMKNEREKSRQRSALDSIKSCRVSRDREHRLLLAFLFIAVPFSLRSAARPSAFPADACCKSATKCIPSGRSHECKAIWLILFKWSSHWPERSIIQRLASPVWIHPENEHPTHSSRRVFPSLIKFVYDLQ